MTTFDDYGMPGIRSLITLDGEDFDVNPATLSVRGDILRTIWSGADGGRRVFAPYLHPSFPSLLRRLTFSLAWENVHGPLFERLAEIESDARVHEVTLWKREKLTWIASTALGGGFMPFSRLDAPRYLARATPVRPIKFTVNGTERTVVYDPTLTGDTAITDGTVHVSSTKSWWRTKPVLVRGDVVRMEWYPMHFVIIEEITVEFPTTIAESRAYALGELDHTRNLTGIWTGV